MNVALDVGADDGFHGILFAFLNPKIKVFAFEPIKGAKKEILTNLKKVEIFFSIKIKNYKILNTAVSDFNGSSIFYETNYRVGSSLLKPKKKLDKFWTNSNDLLIKEVSKGLKPKKKYNVSVTTLEKFCKKNSVSLISYLHIDAQGNDLRVIKGLKNYKKCLIEGVAEVPKNNKLKIYNKEQTFSELKSNFKKWNFKITKVDEVQKNYPSFNVFFRTNYEERNVNDITNFIHSSKRIERIFKRIFSNRLGFKDFIFLFIWKIKRKFL